MKRILPLILAGAGIIVASIQVIFLVQRYIPDLEFVRTSIGEPVVWRSGVNYLGPNFGEYLVFLNEHIPQDAVVILPPRESGGNFIGHTQVMQFFLSPRTVVNCLDLACLHGFLSDPAFILTIDPNRFPGPNADLLSDRLLLMDNGWGMVVPAGYNPPASPDLPRFSNIEAFLLAYLLPGIWFLLISLPGVFLIRLALPGWRFPAQFFAGMILALVLFSLFTFVPLLFGLPLTRGLIYILTTLHLLLAALIGIPFRTRLFPPKPTRPSFFWTAAAWQTFFLLVGGAAILIAGGKGYFSSDAIVIWGAKGYGIANQGIFRGVADWGTTAANYPLATPILIAVLKTLFNEILPASKLIFPLFFLALIFSLWEVFRTRTTETWAAVFTIAVAFAPILVEHSVIGYANLPFTAMFTLAIVLTIPPNETHLNRRNHALLAGLILVLAAWIRPEGIYLVAAYLLVAALIHRHQNADRPQLFWIYLLIQVAIYLILWALISPALYPPTENPSYLSIALSRIFGGDLRINHAWIILSSLLKMLFTRAQWGYMGILLLAATLTALAKPRSLRLPAAHLLYTGLTVLLITAGLTYLVSLSDQPGCDLNCWINNGLTRYAIPGFLLAAAGLFLHVLDLLPATIRQGDPADA